MGLVSTLFLQDLFDLCLYLELLLQPLRKIPGLECLKGDHSHSDQNPPIPSHLISPPVSSYLFEKVIRTPARVKRAIIGSTWICPGLTAMAHIAPFSHCTERKEKMDGKKRGGHTSSPPLLCQMDTNRLLTAAQFHSNLFSPSENIAFLSIPWYTDRKNTHAAYHSERG